MSISSYSCSNVDSELGKLPPSPPSLSASAELLSQPDVMKRDCFELLSAYLDGEVTAKERAIVENWLQSDASVHALYTRLITLRQGFRQPDAGHHPRVEFTLSGVVNRLNYRLRTVTMATAGVLFLATLNILSAGLNLNPAAMSSRLLGKPQPLDVTVSQPVFPIPSRSTPLSSDWGLTPVDQKTPVKTSRP
ncbi:MAG: Fis family transcriptional regulator [Cyanobacteria bacterium REEB459]|nr:Fis family transcriptional regulator [Cyanobacteria bacterium REEB459]